MSLHESQALTQALTQALKQSTKDSSQALKPSTQAKHSSQILITKYSNSMQAALMRKSAEIRSRIEPGLKEQSAEVLASLGLDMSDAIRLFLRQVVEVQGLPFEVRKPNAKTVAAMIEAREMAAVRFGSAKDLFDALESETSAGKTRRTTKKI